MDFCRPTAGAERKTVSTGDATTCEPTPLARRYRTHGCDPCRRSSRSVVTVKAVSLRPAGAVSASISEILICWSKSQKPPVSCATGIMKVQLMEPVVWRTVVAYTDTCWYFCTHAEAAPAPAPVLVFSWATTL
jgi:hypothetical protein